MDHNQGSAALRTWMVEKGKTQTQVASLIGVNQTKVSDWLQGRRISLADAVAIRDAIGVPVESWLKPAAAKRLARSA